MVKQKKVSKARIEQNPSLKDLEVLVGDWEMELSNASFLPSPYDKVKGKVSFKWLENGAYLVMYMGNKLPKTPDATWLIGRDEKTPNFTILYYDSRKVSRVYEMSFSNKIWKIWRNSPDFSQRFEGKLDKTGTVITAYWEKSFDGKKWEHDFDVTYIKN